MKHLEASSVCHLCVAGMGARDAVTAALREVVLPPQLPCGLVVSDTSAL
jgi:hypothetical protein